MTSDSERLARVETKLDRLISMMSELTKSVVVTETNTEEIIEKLNNVNLSGDGFQYEG